MCTKLRGDTVLHAPDRPRGRPFSHRSCQRIILPRSRSGPRRHYLPHPWPAEEASTQVAAALYPELREALLAWSAADQKQAQRVAPRRPRAPAASKDHPSSWPSYRPLPKGRAGAFLAPPAYTPRYQGRLDDVAAQADFLYRTAASFDRDAARGFRTELGIVDLQQPLHTALIAAGWCFTTWARWHPAARVLHRVAVAQIRPRQGWPIKGRAGRRPGRAAAQAMRPARFADLGPEPRMPWVPLPILRAWLEEWTDAAGPRFVATTRPCAPGRVHLHRHQRRGRAASGGGARLPESRLHAVHAAGGQARGPATGEEETRRKRSAGRASGIRGARAPRLPRFVGLRPELVTQLEAYNRLFRGYVPPDYSAEGWRSRGGAGRIVLKPHQRAGAQRLIANQEGSSVSMSGWARRTRASPRSRRCDSRPRPQRPVVVVPNTLIWKWHKGLRAALPDYRIGVIGSERYIGRSGPYTNRIDTPRSAPPSGGSFRRATSMWCSPPTPVFARNSLRAERAGLGPETPALLRMIGLNARNLLAGIKGRSRTRQSRKKTAAAGQRRGHRKSSSAGKSPSLRDEARAKVAEEIAMEREQGARRRTRTFWPSSKRSPTVPSGAGHLQRGPGALDCRSAGDRGRADPGIYWEDLQCDLLVLDEAQNMKNLWPVQQREGGVPKYLGAITEGSDRAWNFAIRAALVRMRTGGSGVVLLSATPAKNSPLEYYTLLGYVDGQAWSRLASPTRDFHRSLPAPGDARHRRHRPQDAAALGGRRLPEPRRAARCHFPLRRVSHRRRGRPQAPGDAGRADPRPDVRGAGGQIRAVPLRLRASPQTRTGDPRMRSRRSGCLQRMALWRFIRAGCRAAQQRTASPSGRGRTRGRSKTPAAPSSCGPRPDPRPNPTADTWFCDNVAVHAWLWRCSPQADFPERVAIFNADQAPNPARRQVLAERFNGVPPCSMKTATSSKKASRRNTTW